MTTATLYGSVSSQAGETVTITVTKPDNTTEALTTTVLADKTFSITKVYTDAGDYKAKAHMDESANYFAWDSNEVQFTVPKTTRTGTLNVTVA